MLAVGRDGLMLPIRGEACYREGATATVSVHDRKGRRLGTVYLGRMPEPGQETLSRQLTALIEEVLPAMERAIAAVGLHHGRGKPSDPVLPPGSQADATSTTPRSAAEVGMGDRLLSCV